MIWVAPLVKSTMALIVSSVLVDKVLDYTSGDKTFEANPEASGNAVAIYQQSWFDKNMGWLFLGGAFCAWLIFKGKK